MKVFAITVFLALVATTYAGYISSGWNGGGGGGGGWKSGGGGGWSGGGGGWSSGGGGGGKIIKVITVSGGGGGGGWPSGGGGGWSGGGGGGGWPSGGGGGWKSGGGGGWSGGGGGWSSGGGGGVISKMNNFITIIWIPSHIGIMGNEKVDQAAKEIANTIAPGHYDSSLSVETTLSILKDEIKDSWNEEWNSTVKPRIKSIKSNFFQKSITWSLSRLDQVKISRIIIGHTKLTHQYLLNKEDRLRFNIKPSLKDNPKDDESIQNLLKYLEESKLYNKL
ncbi:keratin-3, type I cytoskeletal 51 kDa-like [Colletes gigas]|uniref:keratin-3, type I cytoskeletal 51 kDa-like n=1 Tax=Colletes gigas TaxID=935657 RepID=UPI001C9B4445|nr:keratin-3, type I cytoskeletal 51 kDa-like [Colletes gigas]